MLLHSLPYYCSIVITPSQPHSVFGDLISSISALLSYTPIYSNEYSFIQGCFLCVGFDLTLRGAIFDC